MSVPEDVSRVVLTYRNDPSYPDWDYEVLAAYLVKDRAPSTAIKYLRFMAQLRTGLLDDVEAGELVNDGGVYDTYATKDAGDRHGSKDRAGLIRWRYFCHRAFTSYLEATGRNHLIERLPEDVDAPESKRQTRRFSERQIIRMLEAAPSSTVRLSIALMSYSGFRAIEVLMCNPTWFEIREDDIHIRIPATWAKGQGADPNPEHALLSKAWEDPLKRHILAQYDFNGGYYDLLRQIVDSGREAKTLFNYIDDPSDQWHDLMRERYYLNQALKHTAARAGINNADKVTAHCFRRSFIRTVYDTTQDLSTAAKLGRHRDPATTHRFYLQDEIEEISDAYQKVFG